MEPKVENFDFLRDCQYWTFDVGRSTCPQCLDSGVSSIQHLICIPMSAATKYNIHGRRVFDVQSFHCSGQAEFHIRSPSIKGYPK